jgi:hypothetical protein
MRKVELRGCILNVGSRSGEAERLRAEVERWRG